MEKNILVIFGGVSSEYEVSLESAFAVLTNLNREKYRPLPLGISRQGQWFYYCGELLKIREDAWCNDEDCIPAVLSSALCMDKDRAHKLASCFGVRVPKAMVLTRTEGMETAGAFADQVILEEAIGGFEVGCTVLGKDRLTVGEVDEIELAGGFFDYTEKYTLKTSAIHVPARIAGEKVRELQETAKRIYRALGCSGFARVDMFLTPEGEIVFNEVNTIPGFTEHSRYPGMMRAAGYSFGEILDLIIGQAQAKQEEGRSL